MGRHRLVSISDFARRGYNLRFTCRACGHVIDAIERRAKCSACGEKRARVTAVQTEW